MYQMDPQHTGRSANTGPRQLGLLRTFDFNQPDLLPADLPQGYPGYVSEYRIDNQSSAVIAADGTIYATTFGGWLFALRDSGSAGDRLDPAWRFRPQYGSPFHGTAAISSDGGTLYVPFGIFNPPDLKGMVYALRAPASGQDAQVVWQADLGGLVNNSVTLAPDGTIYVVNLGGLLSAIDSSGGRVKWTAQIGSSGDAPFGHTCKVAPALGSDGTVYVTAVTGSLYAVSPPAGSATAGSIKWSFDFGEHLGPTPLVSAPVTNLGNRGQDAIGSAASATIGPDGTIYVGANNSNLYAIDPNGKQKWVFEAERELAGIWTTAVLSADAATVYFGANKGGVYALNTRDGSRKWQYRIAGSVYSSPVLDATGTLYTGSTVGHVFAINSADGQLAADYDAGAAVWTAPSIRPDGTLVVGTRSGRILVLG